MKNNNKKEKQFVDISVANLPAEFIINDPRDFLKQMRSSFLKKARESREMSLDDVAEKCGIIPNELKNIESGKVSAQDMMTLHALSKLYGLDYSKVLYLFKLVEGSTNKKDEAAAACLDPNMDNRTKTEIQKLIRGLKVSR